MRAEAILRKILMILFLPPLTAPPQPSPSEADICCPYAPPAHKRDETFLQGQYLGCAGDTHTSCLCIALLPVKPPTLSFPCCCHPSFGRKVSFPSPEICSSLPMPPSRPLPTPGLSHPLLGTLVLISHIRALLGNVRLSKPCLIHFHKESSHKSQIQQQRNVQQTRKGV